MKLGIKNFRSIRQQEVELAPITVVYGPNGAGKSSLLYALLTLRNVAMNPNQKSNGFFNYGFANLGGYEAVVFDHQKRQDIGLSLEQAPDDSNSPAKYEIAIGASGGALALNVGKLDIALRVSVSFPYPGNQPTTQECELAHSPLKVTWNGLAAKVASQDEQPRAQNAAAALAGLLNAPVESLRRLGMVPLKRGFDKPSYSSVPITPSLTTADEVASLLAGDKYLVGRVSHYLESVFERDFRVHTTPGTAMFSLDSTDRETGTATELVNDGFGVNQTVYFLARCLHSDTELVCVEEPEIHMHPAAVRRIAGVLVQIVQKERKRFVISTHSEQLVLSLLALVAKRELAPSDLACYLARKEQKATKFERQKVTEDGQIEGGLGAFMEGELEDVKAFLRVSE